jgi:hypothetical protein
MRAAIVAMVTTIALLTSVMAGPRKILVLPLDGDAPAEQKTKLNDTVAKLSKEKLDGDVTIGDTTFNETAAAVGCDPAQPACAETVRTTLQVDELIYGSATTETGSTTVIVTRATDSGEPKSQISVIPETDSGDTAEANLTPLFTGEGTTALGSGSGSGSGGGSGSGSGSGSAAPPSHFFDTQERKLGVAIGAGGVIVFVIGLAMWNSASNLQDDIDGHDDETAADIQALKDLEDEAGNKALIGNLLVFTGLAAAAVGGYFLWKDHKNRSMTVTPAPAEAGTGMTLVLGGRW